MGTKLMEGIAKIASTTTGRLAAGLGETVDASFFFFEMSCLCYKPPSLARFSFPCSNTATIRCLYIVNFEKERNITTSRKE